MKSSKYSPVVLFVYARPEHTRRTISSLLMNPEAKDTDLIIYSDAAKDEKAVADVNKVREIISSVEGFKSVRVYFREENCGLAKNIIDGVSFVCEEYGRTIVLEDDIVTSPSFLNYMNQALERYSKEKKVWHVSGWSHPIPSDKNLPETYFGRVMNCWGWATWNEKWKHFSKNPGELIATWSKSDISRFNLDNSHDYWSQVVGNYNGQLNTWAIFWYATIFSNQGLCLNPTRSLVENIGLDGSGENCVETSEYCGVAHQGFDGEWPLEVSESEEQLALSKAFSRSTKRSFINRALNRVKKLVSKVSRKVTM